MRAVVTGASSGIGRQIAHKLSSLGYSIACIGRDSTTLEATVSSLSESISSSSASSSSSSSTHVTKVVRYGNTPPPPPQQQHHTAHICDVSNSTSVAETISNITQKNTLPIHVLINAAGIVQNNLLVRTNDTIIQETLHTNLLGPIHLCREVAKSMLRTKQKEQKDLQHHRSIINIGSVVGTQGNIGQCVYSASKAGLSGLTMSLAKELGPRGVRVNLIEPGFIETEMTQNISTEARLAIEKSIMLGTFGTSEDVAEMVGFLVSHSGKYITGTTINIDGGLRM